MIQSVYTPDTYAGNGATTVFAYNFKIVDQAHIVVTEVDDATGVETVKTISTHYTVSNVGEENGGNVTMVTAPATGKTLVLSLDISPLQSTNFENQGEYFAEDHEDSFDLLTQMVQQLTEEVSRAPKTSIASGETGDDLIDSINDSVAAASASASSAAASAALAQAAAASGIGAWSTASVSVKTDNYTVLIADVGKALVMNAGTAKAFTLPAITGNECFLLKNVGAGVCTITPNGAQTTEVATLNQGDFVCLVGDAANTRWRALAYYPVSSVLTLPDQAAAPTVPADTLKVYSKAVSGVSELFYRQESSGTEYQITSGGKIRLLGPAIVSLTDAATIATDASLGKCFKVTLGGNRTLGNPTNAYDGQILVWVLQQDGTGSRTITLDTKFRYGTDLASGTVVLTTTASKQDYLVAVYDSVDDKFDVVEFLRNY